MVGALKNMRARGAEAKAWGFACWGTNHGGQLSNEARQGDTIHVVQGKVYSCTKFLHSINDRRPKSRIRACGVQLKSITRSIVSKIPTNGDN